MNTIIELKHVTRTFQVKRNAIKAVDDLSIKFQEGEVVCLVGESGCGKTTTGKMIANLLEWPVIYQLNQNFVPMTIILRMILLLLTTWMAYQIIFYRSAGGISYTSGLRSEKTGK